MTDGCTARTWFPKAALGVDTAKWQNPSVPWTALHDTGLFKFASVKWWHGPWRGDTSTVACAEQQHREAKDAGFLVGRYAWWLPGQPIADQVEAWTSSLWPSDEMPLLIDAEEPSAAKGISTRLLLEDLVTRIADKTGVLPWIYSGTWWADAWMPGESSILKACPYWHAAYPGIQSKGQDYQKALDEWLAMKAPTLPAIWSGVRPVGWQADGDHGMLLPNNVDVDVDIADWDEIRRYAPNFGPVTPRLEEYKTQRDDSVITDDEVIASLWDATIKKADEVS